MFGNLLITVINRELAFKTIDTRSEKVRDSIFDTFQLMPSCDKARFPLNPTKRVVYTY